MLVGFSARNHPQQAVRDFVDDRRTPRAIFDPLNDEHSFTVDVAASEENALCERRFTRETDGLLWPWKGERVWCNPPFSRIEPWVAKAWQEMRDRCERVVMILPANRTEQRWWQTYVEPFRDRGVIDGLSLTTRFIAGRPKFAAPGAPIPTKGDRPPFGCVLLTWRRHER
jgi:phage N-6-adenine-methyltransferase